MRISGTTSLNLRLWAVIALAVVPVFLMVLIDYLAQRTETTRAIEADMIRMLAAAGEEEDAARRAVSNVFRVIAQSDNLRTLDPLDCSGIAQRLLGTMASFHNLGGALPDGKVFCSGTAPPEAMDVRERRWFRHALDADGVTEGEYLVGRDGIPAMEFGYPLRGRHGELRAVLFASISLDWFRRLVAGYRLPAGWEAHLITTSGRVLARHPAPDGWQGEEMPGTMLGTFLRIRQGAMPLSEAEDFDGHRRLYGVAPVSFARDTLFVVIGAPLESSLSAVDLSFWRRVALLLTIVLVSAGVARYFIYGLVDRWATQMREAIGRIAAGRLDTRITRRSRVRELNAVEDGVNRMAAELERRDAELAEREDELRRLSMAMEQSAATILITDTDARIEYVNEAAITNTGYSRDELLGHNPRILNSGRTPAGTYVDMWTTLGRGEVWRGEFHNTRKDGSCFVEAATIAPVKRADGVVTHYVAVKEDITLRRQSEELLHRLAYYDPLTELPNRAMLHDRLQHALLASAQSGTYAMLLLLDVDRFKQLNDTQGHAAGDRLLKEIAHRLRHALHDDDTIARHGDDDFAVIVEHLGDRLSEALIRAEALAKQIHQALNVPYQLDDAGRRHYATHSIGVTLFQGRQWSEENLLKQVEVALYMAKNEGRNAIRFFSPKMQALVDAHAAMEAGLRDALAGQALQLFYQPQVDQHGRVVGAEALIRWFGADGRLVPPAEFIPVAEDTGLIVPIGQWVLDTACAQLAVWQALAPGFTLAVNVSPRQFHQPDFVDQVIASVKASGIDPRGLELELTESVILGDLDETIARMEQLRTLGLRFSLDDFGTGYSSLSYLKRLPFDQLKIDQSFVRDMLNDASSETIVRAILGMSASLGLEVQAEGVETAAQRDFLHAQGCRLFQGYLFARPLPLAQWPENPCALQLAAAD
ncbi:bifunctional diguanylate cyclase/phosphodiesterase [Thauera sinica]|uniref:EAL domain-containing protein n=1 Tax=Thauera sinica TaxID=2665146 RepID=A0ABW1ATS8_9RHOO|nr:EAL domain-containing protein [Thauera sp. K11]ATE61908.1 GGDEF domain-containing protein [Thauera sp. K11]